MSTSVVAPSTIMAITEMLAHAIVKIVIIISLEYKIVCFKEQVSGKSECNKYHVSL